MFGKIISRLRNHSRKCLSTGSLPPPPLSLPFPRYFFPKQRAKIVWVFWLERVNSFWTSFTMFTVFGVFCYCHFVIKSRATCRPKSRCQSDLSTVSVLANKSLHQDLMHSTCCGTAVPNVCLQAFSLFPLPSSPLDQRPVHVLANGSRPIKYAKYYCL